MTPKERPILFSGPMVRAILNGTKTQTRRIVKPQPDENGLSFMRNAPLEWRDDVHGEWMPWKGETPNGDTWRGRVQCWVGDRLWVRETFAHRRWRLGDKTAPKPTTAYRADGEDLHGCDRWIPSIHMPRWASRITLEVVSVRVERLCDISEEDAIAEGIHPPVGSLYYNYVQPTLACGSAVQSYHSLWDSINGHESWFVNPWVWVVTFKRINP